MAGKTPYSCANFLNKEKCDRRLMDLFKVTNDMSKNPAYSIDLKKFTSALCEKCSNYLFEEGGGKRCG